MNKQTSALRNLAWLILAALVFLIDLLSKRWVLGNFDLYQSIKLLPFFSFTYVRNYGAAFGILLNQRWLLAVIAIVVSATIITLFLRNKNAGKFYNAALALILGGALGNLFDRLYYGYVVDFLDVNFGDWHYPTFNLADSAICVGVAMILISSLLCDRKLVKAPNKES